MVLNVEFIQEPFKSLDGVRYDAARAPRLVAQNAGGVYGEYVSVRGGSTISNNIAATVSAVSSRTSQMRVRVLGLSLCRLGPSQIRFRKSDHHTLYTVTCFMKHAYMTCGLCGRAHKRTPGGRGGWNPPSLPFK